MIKLQTNVDKTSFWKYLCYKTNYIVHSSHIFSVMVILFEEMFKDLEEGKKIQIHNFGTLEFQIIKSRKHFDFFRQKIGWSKSRRLLKFKLSSKLKKTLIKMLDIDKTFKNNYNGEKNVK